MRTALWTAVLLSVLCFTAPPSYADLVTFDLRFSGASFGNEAQGFGSITFDDDILQTAVPFYNVTAQTLGITAFSITISGASSGNGTFGLADVTDWVWDVSSPLDFSKDLVGQNGFNDFNWCASLFDGCIAPAPGGIGPFTIETNAETGDILQLVSMRAVPEPSPLVVLSLGVVAVMALKWKRKGTLANIGA